MKKWLILLGLLVFANSALAEMRVDVPASVKQGGVMRISLKSEDDVRYPILVALYTSGNDIPLFKTKPIMLDENNFFALIPINVHQEPGEYRICTFGLPNTLRCDEVKIQKVDFPESKRIFPVMKSTPEILARYQKERVFLDDIYALVTPKRYFSENLQFANPLEKMEIIQNSDFGQIRKKVLVNRKTGKIEAHWKDYHKGADFRAFSGTPIFAVDSGKVVAARNLLGSGNTVIIDHGYGLISLYFHLSKTQVKEGMEVRRGQKIGLAGMSGNAEGPHLHFEVRLYSVPVNPFEFLR